jgi:hypothetical protein
VRKKLKKFANLTIPGIEVTATNQLKAYPPQILDIRVAAQQLGEALLTPPLKLESLLRGRNRYEVLKRQITPESPIKLKTVSVRTKGKTLLAWA